LASLSFILITSLSAQVLFEDRTAALGLNKPQSQLVEGDDIYCRQEPQQVGGVAAGDFNGDGWPDLYVTRLRLPNLLYRNQQDGTFEEVAESAGVNLESSSAGCAWLDVDNDGDLDLHVVTLFDRNYLYVNDGARGFTEEAEARGLAGEFGDTSSSIVVGDYDLDGDVDVFVAEWPLSATVTNRLHRNDGSGFFEEVTAAVGLEGDNALVFAGGFVDYNDDGRVDLLLAGDFGTSRVYRNLGQGFANVAGAVGAGTDENGMGSALADYDGDGDIDWFVTSIYDPEDTCAEHTCRWGATGNRLYRNDNGTFADVTDDLGVRDGGWGWATTFLDFDNDADLDLIMTAGIDYRCDEVDDPFSDDPMRLWRNDGGTMVDVAQEVGLTTRRSGKGLAVLDYDRDGHLDVFVANNGDEPAFYRNSGSSGSWLQVELRGTTSNSFGLGSRIRVQVGSNGTVQHSAIHGHSNCMSHDEPVAHFGLGPGVTMVDRIEIDWPSTDQTQVLQNIAANQRITVTEGVSQDDPPVGSTGGACGAAAPALAVVGGLWCIAARRRRNASA
jgi:hypothetical protein